MKDLIDFTFQIVAHKKQRYDTVGDYFQNGAGWCFRVSRMKDKRYCWLVFLHEIIEWAICRLTGVKQHDIDRFDMAYEKGRKDSPEQKAPCGCRFEDDPGDDMHAPYREAHAVASQCERLIAKALHVDWAKYDEAVMSL